jgi:ATP-dependent DNA helicase RecQ
VEDGLTIARKILSAVARVRERFGAHHVVQVLRGKVDEKVTQFEHHTLSTFGLLSETGKTTLLFWIEQLVNQGFLSRHEDYKTLALTDSGQRLMRAIAPIPEVILAQPLVPDKSIHETRQEPLSLGTTLGSLESRLFERLRVLRLTLARERRVPPYVIFSDATLRELCDRKPDSLKALASIKGVGDQKRETYGPQFIEAIQAFLTAHG